MELKDLCEKVEVNTRNIALISKDIVDVIPMKIDQVVGDHFKAYRAEKAKFREEEAKKAGKSKGFWESLDYKFKAGIATVVITGGYSIIKVIDIAGAALKAKFGLQ